jgi:hypothetical protein
MASQDNNADPSAGNSPASHRSRGEWIFLVALLILTLLATIGFVLATIFGKHAFPATFVALLMGIFVATLAYTSLGGVRGAIFQLGGFKLAFTASILNADLLPQSSISR